MAAIGIAVADANSQAGPKLMSTLNWVSSISRLLTMTAAATAVGAVKVASGDGGGGGGEGGGEGA